MASRVCYVFGLGPPLQRSWSKLARRWLLWRSLCRPMPNYNKLRCHRVRPVCLSVFLYVCLSVACLDLTREWKRRRKPKIDRMEAHRTSNPWTRRTHLEIKRSKVKVISSEEEVLRISNFVHRWSWWPASPTSTMAFKVKSQGSDVTWCVWHMLAHKSTQKRKITETPKLVGRFPTRRAITRTSFKVKSQGSRSPGKLMLELPTQRG